MDKQDRSAAGTDEVEAPETAAAASRKKKKEVGGPAGPEPTRYGDWERNGRCVDF